MWLDRTALLVFEGNAILVQLLLMLTWRQAIKGGLVFGSNVPRRAVFRLRLLLMMGLAAFIIATGLAFISPAVSAAALAAAAIAQMIDIARRGY